ncbi:MAG TPA: ketoacyl-ACP synthase III [Anaerolineaceae bacterium]|nr:ketoacyl-ACP synthase III [Anaerolineaceae bacterium]
MARYATILSSGRYIPENEITNATFAGWMSEVNPKLAEVVGKFEASSGITTRFYAPDNWATSDLATEAGKLAIAEAGIKPEDIDMVILGTDSPDYTTPATSVVVQFKLGCINAGTYDVGCACASFPTALAQAAGLIAVNPHMKYILVIGAYMMHKLADVKHDVTAFFYGDGAGAAVLGVSDKPGYVSTSIKADGSYHKNWGIYSGGTYEPATVESVEAGRTKVKLVTPFPPTVNHLGWPARVRECAANGGFDLQEIDHIIFTQVNKNSIKTVMEDLGLPVEKAHFIADKWGYMGSACLPIAFDDAWKSGIIKSGMRVVFCGSGVGYNQAATCFIMP